MSDVTFRIREGDGSRFQQYAVVAGNYSIRRQCFCFDHDGEGRNEMVKHFGDFTDVCDLYADVADRCIAGNVLIHQGKCLSPRIGNEMV